MTLEQLRIFVGVAEREHVTAAARALNVTQSAASAAIAALEERHGIKLFDRVGRGVRLTETGRAFLDEARGVLARVALAEMLLEEFGGLRRGSLRVVASQTIAAYWLPRVLVAFHDRYPGITVDLMIGNTGQAASMIREGAADIGIIEGKIDDPVLEHWPIGEDRLVLIAAIDDPIPTVDAAWLETARWVIRETGSGTRSALEEGLRAIGVALKTIDNALILPSNESVRSAVEAGAGIAALSSLVVSPGIAAGRLQALPVDFGPRSFFGVRHKERYRTRAADALLDMIAELDPLPGH